MILTSAILAPRQDGEQLGEVSNPGLKDLFAPLVQHFFGEREDRLSELVVQDIVINEFRKGISCEDLLILSVAAHLFDNDGDDLGLHR